MHQPCLILASSSKTRAHILKQLKTPFIQRAPNIDETPLPGEQAEALVKRLAIQKAQKIAPDFNQHLIISSDQTLEHPTLGLLGKPKNHAHACTQLLACQGKKLTFYTSLCVFDGQKKTFQTTVSCAHVHYHSLTPAMIEYYLNKEQPYHCVGSIQVDGLGSCLIKTIESDDPNTILGLPLCQLNTMLKTFNYDILNKPNSVR
jgi:septum formation protein